MDARLVLRCESVWCCRSLYIYLHARRAARVVIFGSAHGALGSSALECANKCVTFLPLKFMTRFLVTWPLACSDDVCISAAQLNQATSQLDLSQLYGHGEPLAGQVQRYVDGELLSSASGDAGETLPEAAADAQLCMGPTTTATLEASGRQQCYQSGKWNFAFR